MYHSEIILMLTKSRLPLRCKEIAARLKYGLKQTQYELERLLAMKLIEKHRYSSNNRYYSVHGFPLFERTMLHAEARLRIRKQYPAYIWFRAKSLEDGVLLTWMKVDKLVDYRINAITNKPEYKFKEGVYAD